MDLKGREEPREEETKPGFRIQAKMADWGQIQKDVSHMWDMKKQMVKGLRTGL